MIDHTYIDLVFDHCIATHGQPPANFLFDRRVLMPLTMVPDAVHKETGHEVTYEKLLELLEAHWFERLEYAGENDDELGIPIYVPSRIGLFLDLRRVQGYTDNELAAFAEEEDGYVANVLSVDEFACEDNDLLEVARHYREEIGRIEEEIEFSERARDPNQALPIPRLSAAKISEFKRRREDLIRIVDWYASAQIDSLSAEIRLDITRIAFHIRSFNDAIRFMLVNQHRMKARAGYSTGVALRTETFGADVYEPGQIDWAATLFGPGLSEAELTRLRIPGAILDGRTVTLTRSPKPGEYERLWKEYDLEEYFALVTKVQGERVCRNCLAALPDDVDERRRYCDEACRHAAKQKRYRKRNPRAAAQAQWKYWNSVTEPKPTASSRSER